jgi:hypothetical protein
MEMMRLLSLLPALFALLLQHSTGSAVFEELSQLAGLEKGQCLIVFVGQIGECEKCVYTLKNDFQTLSRGRLAGKWKNCVLLQADRQIHCTAFHKRYPWTGPVTLMKDYGKQLALQSNTRLAIFSNVGQLLKQYSYEDFLSVSAADIQSVILKAP